MEYSIAISRSKAQVLIGKHVPENGDFEYWKSLNGTDVIIFLKEQPSDVSFFTLQC